MMAQFIIQNLEDDLQRKLCALAQSRGKSVEEFVGEILRKIANEREVPEPELGSRIAARFSESGLSVPLEQLPRQTVEPPVFDQ